MKKLLAVFTVIVLLLQVGIVVGQAADESGTPKHIPRVVSILFDDSSSMHTNTDRWAYASYAMQAFTAMMGSDDVLYVTFLYEGVPQKVDLSIGNKQATIDKFGDILFQKDTPNNIQNAAQPLKNEYKKYGTSAEYYFIVMTDGELNGATQDESKKLENVLPPIVADTKAALGEANFATIFFDMKEKPENERVRMSGITTREAFTSKSIITQLNSVSAEIMGRTDLTKDSKVSGGKLTFKLKYPALNIALIAQKENAVFENVKLPIEKDKKSVPYGVDTYYVECPTSIRKTYNYTEVVPTSPPNGFVSLLNNGNSPLPKGEYTIDLSAYGLTMDNIAVLVEPAVKIGCKYYVGDDDKSYPFADIKDKLRINDTVRVECGLYEINDDGSLGDAVPKDVLSPDYKVYVNNDLIGEKFNDNTYIVTIKEEYKNKDLKIEAKLEGYQPFVLRERFGDISFRLGLDLDSTELKKEIQLTKPDWQKWTKGDGEIVFPLKQADNTVLENIEIFVSGFDKLKTGKCSDILDCVKLSGNNVVYSPKLLSDAEFGALPESFSVGLKDLFDNKTLMEVKVKVVQPKYKLEIKNELEGESLGLGLLKNNTKGVEYTLLASYDGSEKYSTVEKNGCEKDVIFEVDSGDLPGAKTEDFGSGSFVPKFDPDVNTDISVEKVLGKDHSLTVTAKVEGKEVAKKTVDFSVKNAEYKLVVENGISSPFTLDTIKNNDLKVVFKVLADYSNSGDFGELADWDTGVCGKIKINSGELPGTVAEEKDASGKVIGKSFTPLYDENNNNGIVFTKVAGKVHTVSATIENTKLSEKTTVEVLAPKYDVKVKKDGLKFVDTALRTNEEGVEFEISRNDRILTKAEIEAMAPYDLKLSKNEKSVVLKTVAVENDGETAYLEVIPQYDCWTFIHPNLWNWLSLWQISIGETDVILTVGTDSATAKIDLSRDEVAYTIFWIVVFILAIIVWLTFCYLTRTIFQRGSFYTFTLVPSRDGYGYTAIGLDEVKSNQGSLKRFILNIKSIISKESFFGLFSIQERSFELSNQSVLIKTRKNTQFQISSKPQVYYTDENKESLMIGSILPPIITGIIEESRITVTFDQSPIIAKNSSLSYGRVLFEAVENTDKLEALMFVPKNKQPNN